MKSEYNSYLPTHHIKYTTCMRKRNGLWGCICQKKVFGVDLDCFMGITFIYLHCFIHVSYMCFRQLPAAFRLLACDILTSFNRNCDTPDAPTSSRFAMGHPSVVFSDDAFDNKVQILLCLSPTRNYKDVGGNSLVPLVNS